jgi:hypothetical protein
VLLVAIGQTFAATTNARMDPRADFMFEITDETDIEVYSAREVAAFF